jgi:CubicO group peptidase (beta-lactamase class C family)
MCCRKCFAGFAICFLAFTTAAAGQQPDNAAQVDRLFAAWDRKDSPGCVVLVRQDGKTLHERAYGMANLELGVPLSLSSVFLLASVSKQFIVFLIMLLAQGGQLSLDDDIRKHVPEVPDFGKTITIRHLIHHTSGLREDLTSFNLAGWRSGDVITREDFLRFVKNQKDLNFNPDAQYLYCNTGYHLLAIIAERVAKKPVPQFADESIFRPLGMKATVVRDQHRKLIANLVAPYGPRFDRLEKSFPNDAYKLNAFQLARVAHDMPGASNIHSTVGDLARWDQNFYDAKIGDKKLLDAMQTKAKLNNGKEIKYAGGLMIDAYRGLKTVSHTGSHGGYKTVILRFPDQRFSVIILANVRDFVPMRLAKKVADVYLHDRLEPQTLPEEDKLAGPELEAFKGEYRFAYSLWRVGQAAKGGLYVQVDGGEKKRLVPSAPTEFFDREDGMRYRFVKKKDDMLLETSVEKVKNSGKRMRFTEPAAEKLAELTGAYRSTELDVFTSVVIRDGKIVLQMPKSEAALQFLDNGDCLATPKDAFFSMFVIRFTRNTAGSVTGYTLSTERVRNLRYTKAKSE